MLLRLRLKTVGECCAPLLDDIKAGTRFVGELVVAVNTEVTEYLAQDVDQFKEGRLLNFSHGVCWLAVSEAADVDDADGVVVASGMRSSSPDGSSSLDSATTIVEDDEVVADV